MLVDLHCHTTASDGTLSPGELIARACANQVELLAITDHDTLAAYRQLPPSIPLTLITGVEFSCQWQKRGLHIVGLNVALDSAALKEAEDQQHQARETRSQMIAERLAKYGVPSPLEGALTHSNGDAIGRPHFARHMVAAGFVRTTQEAFKKYLGNGKPCDIKVCWPEPGVVIRWIRDAGGIPVLAHPGKYTFTRSRLQRCVEDFSALGGLALEVVSGRQLPAQTRQFVELANHFGLHSSLGSDFHSPEQTWLDLGRYSTPPTLDKPVWALW